MNSREESVYHQLSKTGLLERVRELMRVRLMECGWRDQVRLECRKILNRGAGGGDHAAAVDDDDDGDETDDNIVTVNDLVKSVTPQARALVPDSIKRELLHELETGLADISQINKYQ